MYTIGMTLPAVFGATPPKGNYADLKTTGWEASLSWRDRLNIGGKPFNFEIKGSLADNKSVIKRYNNPEKVLTDYYEGQVIGEIWGYVTEGFFVNAEDIANHADQTLFKNTSSGANFPGDLKLVDSDGSGKVDYGTNRIGNTGDKQIIGNSATHYTYTLNLNADWNNFFVSLFFQGVGKQDWWPRAESPFWGQYNRPYNPLPKWQLGNTGLLKTRMLTCQGMLHVLPNRSGSMLVEAPQTKYLQNLLSETKNIRIGYNLPANWFPK
jgi:hypothetical protein